MPAPLFPPLRLYADPPPHWHEGRLSAILVLSLFSVPLAGAPFLWGVRVLWHWRAVGFLPPVPVRSLFRSSSIPFSFLLLVFAFWSCCGILRPVSVFRAYSGRGARSLFSCRSRRTR
ncbi:hypothetical protein B0H17DRAFT_1095910 [Mycena rosella]|uniref:Transmembrane protein n=1 Tax=Mycena rosella TaxID=1033263 RepID=A0AAD7CRT3_MYCRO|nr:hypothetical protein B0H17DRAFT_1095910 [Mycena rosella]